MSGVTSRWLARAFNQTLASVGRAHLLRIGLRSGLFESLREPRTAAQLADSSQLEADLVQAFLRAAEAQGLLRATREAEPAYQVDGLARWLLDAPDSAQRIAQLDQAVESHVPVFERVPLLLRGASRPQFGKPAEAQRAAQAARLVERPALEALSRIPGARRARRVLDVGCGYGTYLCRLLDRYRDAHGVGIERDGDVAGVARANLRDADLSRRAEVLVGDFATLELDGAFDLVLLNNNLYYFPPADHPALFERIASLLVSGGVVAVQLPVVSDSRGAAWMGLRATHAAFDLYLRAHSNLYGLPDLGELHATMRGAGFTTLGEVAFLPGGAARYVWGQT